MDDTTREGEGFRRRGACVIRFFLFFCLSVCVFANARLCVCFRARMATDARRGEISRETPQTDLCETSGVDWTRDAVVRDLEASTSTDTNAAGRNRALVAVPAPGERAESDARVVAAAGFCQCVGGETQVMQIATRPSLRRRGLGTRMLKAMLGLVPDNTGVLEARASNDGALAMYEKCGFERVGVRRGYYSDGEDAVCMTRTPSERPVSTRELTRLLAGLDAASARKPAPPLPEREAAAVKPTVVDAPREIPFVRDRDDGSDAGSSDGGFKMRNRIRRR